MAAIDLNAIKTEIKLILDTANTTTAAVDLSANLSGDRIQKIVKFDPEAIPAQADFYPLVSIWIDRKSVEPGGMAGTQARAKRIAEIDFKIVGATTHSGWTNLTEDPPTEDRNHLMENIEDILRNNDTLNGKVLWHFPSEIIYAAGQIEEDTFVKAGILTLRTKVQY